MAAAVRGMDAPRTAASSDPSVEFRSARTRAVLDALHGLDPLARLAVLAMAERQIHIEAPDADDLAFMPVEAGQAWACPNPRYHNRVVLSRDGDEVQYEDRSGVHTVRPGVFRAWIKATRARPL